jgi:hypothetical protein
MADGRILREKNDFVNWRVVKGVREVVIIRRLPLKRLGI